MAFRGANNPKLANVIVSQNRRTTRNGTGTDVPVPANTSHLACNSASARSSARDWSARWESSRGVRPRIASASPSASDAAPERIGSRLAGWDEPCGQIMSIRTRNRVLQARPNLAGLGPVARQYVVEREDFTWRCVSPRCPQYQRNSWRRQ